MAIPEQRQDSLRVIAATQATLQATSSTLFWAKLLGKRLRIFDRTIQAVVTLVIYKGVEYFLDCIPKTDLLAV